MDTNTPLQHYRKKVDTKLIVRQRIFFVVIAVLFIINVTNVVFGNISFLLAMSGFIVSFALGLILSRMFKIFWHEEKAKVMSRLDTVGTVLLVIYILIELNKNWIFQHWFSGTILSSFGLIVLSGLLFGRFVGTFFRIKEVLDHNK